MKTKNLMIGNIARIEYTEISLEDYWPSAFYDSAYVPQYTGTSVFYVTNSHAYDLRNFRRYKIAQATDNFPSSMDGEKVVIIQNALSDITEAQNMTRKEAIKTYQKTRNN